MVEKAIGRSLSKIPLRNYQLLSEHQEKRFYAFRTDEKGTGANQMGIQKLISLSVTLAIITVSTGQTSKVLKAVRIAQLKLIKDSQASKWGTPMIPPNR